jgi:putative tryptophan/tyrosine transport system substrate-binding protein
MKRRAFIALLGGAAAAWPLATRAQQAVMPVIGFLNSGSPDLIADLVRAFGQGLGETGYVDGRNVAIEFRWAEDGLVVSLNRPGGNLTGVVSLSEEVLPKRLELLHEMVPTASVIGLLINPTNSTAETQSRSMQAAARRLGLQLHVLQASTERDFDMVFTTLVQLRAGGLVIGLDPRFSSRSEQLAALAVRHAVPAIQQPREFAAAGGLMSNGTSLRDQYRPLGTYAGKILKGAKPADLPVQQATNVELIINMKTAKALGLTVPLALLARADEVIE